jgi:hypothetical protein
MYWQKMLPPHRVQARLLHQQRHRLQLQLHRHLLQHKHLNQSIEGINIHTTTLITINHTVSVEAVASASAAMTVQTGIQAQDGVETADIMIVDEAIVVHGTGVEAVVPALASAAMTARIGIQRQDTARGQVTIQGMIEVEDIMIAGHASVGHGTMTTAAE